MRFLMSVSALVLFLAVGPNSGDAFAQKTHYVDARMGNDSFDGSTFAIVNALQGPFFTIRRAISKAEPGDVIAIRAGDYTRDGVISVGDKQLTLLLFPGESNQTILLDGLLADTEAGSLTLANSDEAENGVYQTNGDENDLTIQSGTIHVASTLAIAKGGKVSKTGGELTGAKPTMLEE